MQLAITVLGKRSTFFMSDVVTAITTCKCNILELSASSFSHATLAGYLLVEGSWHCVAKLENLLDNLEKRLNVQIQILHTESQQPSQDYIPYRLETITIDQEGIIQDILTFLIARHIVIAEIKSSCYPAPYTQTRLLSTTFVIFIPLAIQILSFREEVLAFCDTSNIDAIFEPIRR
jgi:glycine cleavage system transcriptional repressor